MLQKISNLTIEKRHFEEASKTRDLNEKDLKSKLQQAQIQLEVDQEKLKVALDAKDSILENERYRHKLQTELDVGNLELQKQAS